MSLTRSDLLSKNLSQNGIIIGGIIGVYRIFRLVAQARGFVLCSWLVCFCVNSCIFIVFGINEDKRSDLTGSVMTSSSSSVCQTSVPSIEHSVLSTNRTPEHQFHVINHDTNQGFEPCPGNSSQSSSGIGH